MIRQRLYNPAHLTPDELKRAFVARQDTLEELLRLIGEQLPGRPCQHMMLIGPRGMGKTTLGLRFLYAIGDNTGLSEHWQSVAFHEESYGVVNLADFWVAALRHLARATEESRWADRADALTSSEQDTQRLAAYALAALMDFSQESGKRLILFVENIDTVLGQMQDEREIHELRATLMERPEILLLGSANAFFDAIGSYGQPFYEFFRIFKLDSVGEEDARRLLMTTAEREDRPEVYKNLSLEHGRLEIIRRLTGGNPRLLALACRVLIEAPLGSAMEDLERLIDEQTPYFKALVEGLPVQARKVFHCLSEGWRPMLAKEVAQAARLSSSHASAQLKQLLEKAYVREVRLRHEKRTRYDVADRFYNIYYLLRFSRTSRDRLERLVAFLYDLFGAAGMRQMYPTALANLRANRIGEDELSDWLGVLAPRVARDPGFAGRDDWLNQACDVVVDRIGPNAPVMAKLAVAVTEQPYASKFEEWMRRAAKLVEAGSLMEAEEIWRSAVEDEPHNGFAWLQLGAIRFRQNRFQDAIAALDGPVASEALRGSVSLLIVSLGLKGISLMGLERNSEALSVLTQATAHIDPSDTTVVARLASVVVWGASGLLLDRLGRHEEAVAALHRASECIRAKDPSILRKVGAMALSKRSGLLAGMGKSDEAFGAREAVAEFVNESDSEELRVIAVTALAENGSAKMSGEEYDEALSVWGTLRKYVRVSDSERLRFHALIAEVYRVVIAAKRGEFERMSEILALAASYLRREDPPQLLRGASEALAAVGTWLMTKGRHADAESVSRTTIDIFPDLDESWAIWAQAILAQRSEERWTEAERYARRAVELGESNPMARQTLSDVLARRGRWPESLEQMSQALRVGGDEFREREQQRVADSLIGAAAAGQGPGVKRIMAEYGLVESMEPLWHGVRAQLGEELESLPAEVMDAVMEVRRRIRGDHGNAPGNVRTA